MSGSGGGWVDCGFVHVLGEWRARVSEWGQVGARSGVGVAARWAPQTLAKPVKVFWRLNRAAKYSLMHVKR